MDIFPVQLRTPFPWQPTARCFQQAPLPPSGRSQRWLHSRSPRASLQPGQRPTSGPWHKLDQLQASFTPQPGVKVKARSSRPDTGQLTFRRGPRPRTANRIQGGAQTLSRTANWIQERAQTSFCGRNHAAFCEITPGRSHAAPAIFRGEVTPGRNHTISNQAKPGSGCTIRAPKAQAVGSARGNAASCARLPYAALPKCTVAGFGKRSTEAGEQNGPAWSMGGGRPVLSLHAPPQAYPAHARRALGWTPRGRHCAGAAEAVYGAGAEEVEKGGGDAAAAGHGDDDLGSLYDVAGIVGMATLGSKALGTIRETALAAAFGVGPVMNGFSYASIAPGFFLSLLGGINGPFHSAMTSALSKRSREEGRELVAVVSSVVGVAFAGVSLAMFVAAELLIDLAAPGLLAGGGATGAMTRSIAVAQLRVMAPCAFLAGLIGVGFGSLTAARVYVLPSLSPALTSIAILIAVAIHFFRFGSAAVAPQHAMAGGITLALGMTAGACAQWLLQAVCQVWAGLALPTLRFADPRTHSGLHEVLSVMIPGAVASGMMQIATYTDLYFASFIPGAGAALGYANLLVQAPLGILSSALLVPILPLFARLSKASDWPELRKQVRRGVLLATAVTLPLTATMVPLADPMVRVVFQRKAFDAAAAGAVAPLVSCYSLGAVAYLTRDVLVRVFYALSDGATPFYVSLVAIGANAVLDWFAVRRLGMGAEGLLLATLFVNAASALVLLGLLARRLHGLDLRSWVRPHLILTAAAAAASLLTASSYSGLTRVLHVAQLRPALAALWHSARFRWIVDVALVGASGLVGISVFLVLLLWLRLPEAESIVSRLQAKFLRTQSGH